MHTPINKTAGMVTGQSGCASDGTLSDEQKRENLVAISKQIQARMAQLKNHSEYKLSMVNEKALIEEIQDVEKAIRLHPKWNKTARKSLCKRKGLLGREISDIRKSHIRLKLNKLKREQRETDLKINAIRPKKKSPGIEKYVLDVLRDEMNRFEFKKLLTKATKRMKEHDN